MQNAAFTALALVLTIFGTAQEYGFDCLMLEDGLPRAHVRSICEDKDGFLVVGTESGGAARFDGHHFLVIDASTGLSDNDVGCLLADTLHDKVYLGVNERVNLFEGGKVTALPYSFPSSITSLFLDSTGVLFAGTAENGVYAWDTEQRRAQPLNGAFARVNQLAYHERLYAATENGLFYLLEGTWQSASKELFGKEVLSLSGTEKGVYLATATDVYLLHDVHDDLQADVIDLNLGEAQPQFVFVDKQHRLWLGTNVGVIKMELDGSLARFSEWSGMSDSDIRTIYQDRSGAIWFGTAYGGLCKFTSEAYVHFSSRSGLGDNIVSGTVRDANGEVWISTFGGGVSRVSDENFIHFGKADGLPSEEVNAIAALENGSIVIGTEEGAAMVRNDTVIRFGPQQSITAILADKNNGLWIAGPLGFYEFELVHEVWELNWSWEHLHGHVSDLDSLNGQILATTDNGVFAFAMNQSTKQPVKGAGNRIVRNGLPEGKYTSMAVGSNGDIWAGTANQGIVRIQNDTATVFSTADGLSANQVELVMLDAYENVWVGTKRGIDMLELDVLQERVLNIDNYTTEDGFIGMEVFRNSGMLDEDGTLWFGTTMGATKYDSEKVLYDATEPRTRIIDLLLNYEHVDFSPWAASIDSVRGLPLGLVLPFNKNHLTFEFAGISLAYPERVRYQYMLEGFEEEWSPITAVDRVTYPSLPPGAYTFKVISRNASGIWNQEPESFAFEVKAPIWQNRWFLGGLAAFLGFLIFSVVKLRERRFRNERIRLESMVNERTKALAKSKKRSEDLLLNILPGSIAKELRDHGKAKAREYPECSVLFSDFKGFTTFSAHMDGDYLVAELDRVFRAFDAINDRYNIEKIKTIGDAYMCASGLPEENPHHALNSVLMGLEMINCMHGFNKEFKADGKAQWHVRVGVHTGPLVAGVVGEKKFAYDIWGDTVNTASRMEHASEADRLNISGVTYSYIMDYIDATVRGPLSVKGKGELMMYFVDRIKPEFSADEKGLIPNERLLNILQANVSLKTD